MREESKYVDCKMANMISNDWSDFICQKNIYLFTSLDEWALMYMPCEFHNFSLVEYSIKNF